MPRPTYKFKKKRIGNPVIAELKKYCDYYHTLKSEIQEELLELEEDEDSLEWNSRPWWGNEMFYDYIADYNIMEDACPNSGEFETFNYEKRKYDDSTIIMGAILPKE